MEAAKKGFSNKPSKVGLSDNDVISLSHTDLAADISHLEQRNWTKLKKHKHSGEKQESLHGEST